MFSRKQLKTILKSTKIKMYALQAVCFQKEGKGKVSFMDLWDRSGKIQIFAKFDDLGEEEYGFLKSGISAISLK